METGLAGRVVIVTGATVNIGRGIALAFAVEAARVGISAVARAGRRAGQQRRGGTPR